MSEQLPEVIAFDASRKAYMPIIEDAAKAANWKVLPYDEEAYAMEDLAEYSSPTLVAVLHELSFINASYPGKALIELATLISAPHAIIADEAMQSSLSPVRLNMVAPNLFITRQSQRIVEPLSSWLVALSHER